VWGKEEQKMERKYITIEREYGSGGTRIAEELSAKTGIPCYGRDFWSEKLQRFFISFTEML